MLDPHTLHAAVLFLCAVAADAPSEGEPAAERWSPVDIRFRSTRAHANPFEIRLSAEVRGPDGVRVVPGFYDGDGTFIVRVCPTSEGEWSLVTTSDDPDLDGRTASFTCTANRNARIHGGLKVDAAHPYQFVWEDGTRCFPLGYECDWLWALDMGNPALPTLLPFLDKLEAHGFNQIILNAYAHDTGWRPGRSEPEDYGPPAMFAWEGSNEQPDHTRLNPAFWRHYDRMMTAMLERGIVAHLMVKVYNKLVTWPEPGSAEDDLYFRWLIARYAAFPNLVWDFSKEANNEPSLDYKLDRIGLIRREDPYHRLITVHDDHATYDAGAYDEVLDFRSDQQHGDWHSTILEHRAQRRWPVVNVEFGYEHGPRGADDATYGVVQPPEEVLRRAWEILMAGGHIAYYYTYTAWDVIRTDDTPPGYRYFRQLREFMERTQYWLMEPHDDLVSAGHCLAAPGREYIVHLDVAQPLEVDISAATASMRAEWFDPVTGNRSEAGEVAPGEVRVSPPEALHARQAVLHLVAR